MSTIPFRNTPVNSAITPEFIDQKLAQLRNKGQRRNTSDAALATDKYIKIVVGKPIHIRILPGAFYQAIDEHTGKEEWFQKSFYAETAIHRLGNKNLHCPKHNKKDRCPVCEYINMLWRSNQQVNIDLAKDIKAKPRFYTNVVQRERLVYDPVTAKEVIQNNVGPLILSVGQKLYERILSYWNDREVGDLTNLYSGFDFVVNASKQGEEYVDYSKSEAGRRQCDAGTEEEIQRWMQNLHDLDGMVECLSTAELKTELESFIDIKVRGMATSESDVANLAMPSTAAQSVGSLVAEPSQSSIPGVSAGITPSTPTSRPNYGTVSTTAPATAAPAAAPMPEGEQVSVSLTNVGAPEASSPSAAPWARPSAPTEASVATVTETTSVPVEGEIDPENDDSFLAALKRAKTRTNKAS